MKASSIDTNTTTNIIPPVTSKIKRLDHHSHSTTLGNDVPIPAPIPVPIPAAIVLSHLSSSCSLSSLSSPSLVIPSLVNKDDEEVLDPSIFYNCGINPQPWAYRCTHASRLSAFLKDELKVLLSFFVFNSFLILLLHVFF